MAKISNRGQCLGRIAQLDWIQKVKNNIKVPTDVSIVNFQRSDPKIEFCSILIQVGNSKTPICIVSLKLNSWTDSFNS